MSEGLFCQNEQDNDFRPLADRVRPSTLQQYVGQTHLLGKGKPLRLAIEKKQLHSMVFWGPPGTGKTTLASLIANYCDAKFITLSAVLSGVKDIRTAIEAARHHKQVYGRRTILFIDEVHRFNKAQQDAFLPHIENGTIYFIGATTENPSFELNNALLSRMRVYVLKSIGPIDLEQILQSALKDKERGFGTHHVNVEEGVINLLVQLADGDARKALNQLEILIDLAEEKDNTKLITKRLLEEISTQNISRFDKRGDIFYEQISALHKSVRGSDPDGALFWFCAMLEGGCDPAYIARRIVRMASEDIGNADPRGLEIALNAWQVYERLGTPEGELALAHAVVYLAVAPKSNAVYMAFNQARSAVKKAGSVDVPIHLRNSPTGLMKEQGYGTEYRYSHDEPDAFSPGQAYLPESLLDCRFYHPVNRGLELKITDRLDKLRKINNKNLK